MIDEVVFSLKAVTPALHLDYTGREVGPVLRSFRRIARARQARLYAETVFIPGYVDEREIEKIAGFIASIDTRIPFRIDAYVPIPDLPWESPTVAEITALGERISTIFPHTSYFHGEGGKKELVYPVERLF
jgi:pyruvate-formate lyase-activating enzyme